MPQPSRIIQDQVPTSLPTDAVIIGGNRIPFARAGGKYANVSNQDMFTAALEGLVARYGLQGERIGEVVGGSVLKHSRDFNLVRECVLGSSLSPQTPAYDLQQACATGLEAVIGVSNKIRLGQIESAIAGGTDSISDAPIAVSEGLRRALLKASHAKTLGARIKAFAAVRPADLTLESELQRLLLPKDANDERNVFLEIRAGTGGDESALFAGNLFRMYTRFAERQRWQVEIVSSNESDVGGYREVIARIIGSGVYSKLKFESGAHRVQRVPETETQGRIHTSACTVAVMAEADELEDVQINPAEIRIDTFRASGAGGQHINKTDSAVRIVHLPTGIVVECQDGRSQHKNKAQALSVLVARIKDAQEREQHAKIASERKSLVGSGDRSERIRTYNFPQGRVTDHRINLTLYKIDAIMDGDLDELVGALANEHQAEQLAALAESQ